MASAVLRARSSSSPAVMPSCPRGSTHLPDRPYFDDAVARTGTTRGPRERRVEVGHVDEVVAAELFLGVGVRTVEHLRFAIDGAHGGRRGDRLQAIRALQHAFLA